MPTRSGTRVRIDQIVPEAEAGHQRGDGRSEFDKSSLVAVYDFICEGQFVDRCSIDTLRKSAVRDAIRRLMDDLGYRGFDEEDRDGRPLRARELLTILTGVRDAAENLRWEGEDE